jgi:hypothetical protein
VSRDSVVGIATAYRLDDRGVEVRVPVGSRIFTSPPALRSTQPPIQWIPGALSPGVKRPRREADHSPPTSTEVKKTWVYTSTPRYAFMAQCLVKYRDNFTLPYRDACGNCDDVMREQLKRRRHFAAGRSLQLQVM